MVITLADLRKLNHKPFMEKTKRQPVYRPNQAQDLGLPGAGRRGRNKHKSNFIIPEIMQEGENIKKKAHKELDPQISSLVLTP